MILYKTEIWTQRWGKKFLSCHIRGKVLIKCVKKDLFQTVTKTYHEIPLALQNAARFYYQMHYLLESETMLHVLSNVICLLIE